MKHRASQRFWSLYRALPPETQRLADTNFQLLKRDERHPSLRLKRVGGNLWSARIGLSCRALAVQQDDTLVWFWIGTHAGYDRLVRG